MIIPKKGRESLLSELHREHMGSTKMKQLARSYFWWLELARKTVAEVTCSAGYARPVMGIHFLVMIDAHTKWIETLPTKETSFAATISMMRHWITNDVGHE